MTAESALVDGGNQRRAAIYRETKRLRGVRFAPPEEGREEFVLGFLLLAVSSGSCLIDVWEKNHGEQCLESLDLNVARHSGQR